LVTEQSSDVSLHALAWSDSDCLSMNGVDQRDFPDWSGACYNKDQWRSIKLQ